MATFRGAGGLWEGRSIEEVASPEGFRADPIKVWRFYKERRRNVARARPNPAHSVLAKWQDRFKRYTLATQNVDGLHHAAGSRGVLGLTARYWRLCCTSCGTERDDLLVPLPQLPPLCAVCGADRRIGVVSFGEFLPPDVIAAAQEAAEACDVLVVVGTSAVVYPAAGLVGIAVEAGAKVIEVNPEASALAHLADLLLRAPAGEVLPLIEAGLREG